MSNPHPYVRAALDEIKAAPDDDTPRLMLADWLEENGDAADHDRARVLRLGCEAAVLPAWDPLRRIHDATARALVRRNQAAWLGDVPLGSVTLDRGLFRIRLHEYEADRAHQLLGTTVLLPWLAGIAFVPSVDDIPGIDPVPPQTLGTLVNETRQLSILDPYRQPWSDLLADVDTARLIALSSDCAEPPPDLQAVLARPFDALQELSLEEPPGGWLRSWPGLQRLRTLHLTGTPERRTRWPAGGWPALEELSVTNIDPARFAAGDDWPALRRLAVHYEGATKVPKHLARSSLAGRLSSLVLGNLTATAGLTDLARGPATRLRRLAVCAHVAGSDAWKAIGKGTDLPALCDLCIYDSELDTGAVAILARSPLLGQLDALDLRSCRWNDHAAAAFADLPGLDRLQHLGLGGMFWQAEYLTELTRSRDFSRLRSLDLHGGIGGPGQGVTPDVFPNLVSLNLAGAITAVQFRAMLTWPILPQLRVLDLSGNWFDAADARRLLDAPQLAEANWVRITDREFPPDLRAAWLDRFGPDSIREEEIPF